MSAKTIFIVIITVMVTIFLMLNNQLVDFNFIFVSKPVSKLLVIGLCFIFGFLAGYLAGRPRAKKAKEILAQNNENTSPSKDINEDDKNYISEA